MPIARPPRHRCPRDALVAVVRLEEVRWDRSRLGQLWHLRQLDVQRELDEGREVRGQRRVL
eukprot:4610741-Lingulodinium_polyedra.AAC.1